MKKRDLLIELRALSLQELKQRAVSVAEELMKLRFRNVTGQLEQTHRLTELKRELARIKTIISEQQLKAEA